MVRFSIVFLIGFVFAIGQVHAASAAPQILAAIPIGGALELKCDNHVCAAEVSAICLQPNRQPPARGTLYTVFAKDLSAIAVTGTTTDGQEISLPSTLLKVAGYRGQTAVRFFVEKKVLERRGLQIISVDFDRMVALLPVPMVGDAAPQDTADINHAVSGIRRVGSTWATANADNLAIARVATRVANGLPRTRKAPKDLTDRLIRSALQREKTISPGALGSTRHLAAVCGHRARFTPVRRCLGEFHDQIMLGLNGKYWLALRPGS